MNRFFAPGEEFSRIERMFPRERFAADGRGLGDDAWLWDEGGKTFAVTADASAEGTHYRLDWVSPREALRKALTANLSDINAMGGRSLKAFFNLGARRDWSPETYDALGEELRALERAHGFRVEGGDLLTLPGASFFSFTVIGEVTGAPLLRSACRPGHKVYVSGTLGGSAAGLRALLAGEAVDPLLRRAHLDPAPPLNLGPALAALSAASARPVAAIDVSDGLSSELAHLARASGCALRVDAARLPAHPALEALSSRDPAAARDCVLHGGEEYQLLFTGEFSSAELASLRAVEGVGAITEIGEAFAGEGVFLREHGAEEPLPAKGWSH